MAEQGAFSRYEEAARNLELAAERLDETTKFLIDIGTSVRNDPATMVEFFEDIATSWVSVRNDPRVVLRKNWPDYDRMVSSLDFYRSSKKAEEEAWRQLGADSQKRVNRPQVATSRSLGSDPPFVL